MKYTVARAIRILSTNNEWWDKLSKKEQEDYLAKHKSKLNKTTNKQPDNKENQPNKEQIERNDAALDNTIDRISKKTSQNVWIESNGFTTCLPPGASHDDQARVVFGENGSNTAFKTGWIRLATNNKGKMLFVELTKDASKIARRQLGEIIQTLPDIEYIAISKPGATKPEQAFDASNLRQAFKVINSY